MAISIIGLTTFIIASAGVYIGHVFGNKYEQKAQITGNGIKLSGQMPKTSLILKSERSFYFSH